MSASNPATDEDVSAKTPKASQINRYQRVLHEFMESNLSRAFPLSYRFTEEELSTVTPESILKWMNKKICGDEDADMLHGEIPTPVRCSHHVLGKKFLRHITFQTECAHDVPD